jgi:hypothetical protein
MADSDVLTFVRANLPPPPCRVLEVGAGEELATALAPAGYVVTAIDPESRSEHIHSVALADLEAEPGTFEQRWRSVRCTTCTRSPSRWSGSPTCSSRAPLVIDEMGVVAFDRRAAHWWLRRQTVRGQAQDVGPQQPSMSTARTCIR